MTTRSHKNITAVCKYIPGGATVHMKENANGLIICDQWRKCKGHGGKQCEEQKMHDSKIKGKKPSAKQRLSNLALLGSMMREDLKKRLSR